MRILIAVDWSDEAFSAVRATLECYRPDEIMLVHAVDLRPFDNLLTAPPVARHAFDDFRRAMEDGARQLLDQTAALIPATIPVTRIQEAGSPARIVLNSIQKTSPDLVVLGTRGRSRLAEAALGSTSHRVVVHGDRSTLVVKRPLTGLQRVLLPVEGPEDAARLQAWCRRYAFNQPVDLIVISVVPVPQLMDPTPIPPFEPWDAQAVAAADEIVTQTARALDGASCRVTARAVRGDPATIIQQEAAHVDLVVMGSHGRTTLERWLLGSVSHAITHRVACPVLVVR